MERVQERLAFVTVLLYLSCYVPTSNGHNFSRVIAETTEAFQGHGSLYPPFPSDVDDSEVYAKVLTLFRKYWRNELSDFPPEVVEKLVEARKRHSQDSNSTCIDGWVYLATHRSTEVGPNVSLAVRAVDAFGKPGAGILEGNVIAYGSYDECLSTDHAHYCLVPFKFYGLSLGDLGSSSLIPMCVGMCLPQECTQQDIASVSNAINNILKILNIPLATVHTDPSTISCESEKQLPYNAGAIVVIAVCSLFALLVLIGTFIDWLLDAIDRVRQEVRHKHSAHVNPDLDSSEERTPLLGHSSMLVRKKRFALELITAFSLFKTVPTIMSTNQPPAAITCIHGIRVISLFWVILGHTNYWALMDTGVSNPLHVFTSVTPRFSYQPIVNAFYSVDSFFFLSGLLIAYLTLRNMSRKNGRFPTVMYYVHRYLRLTPSYAFILFFYWFLTMHLANGPGYHAHTDEHSQLYKNCKDYWWTNLLYINNLYPWKLNEECMGWTWYLANDMQFFVVSPLLIVLLYYSPLIGFLSVGVFLAGSFAATGAIAGYYEFDASFMALANLNATTSIMDAIYIKPYARISPYLVGIALGYLLYKKVKVPLNWLYSWIVYIPIWIVATSLGMAVVYGLYDTWHGHTLSLTEDVLYITFSRFAWGLALALLVFACHNGYGGAINSFLSMKFWIPLSRVCYNAYLVHEIALTVITGDLRNPVYYTDITVAVYAIAVAALSFGAAGVVAVFVEFPLGSVEVLLFKVIGLSSRESTRRGTDANSAMRQTAELR